MSKIAVDQLISAPLGTAVFFTSMKWLEGRSNEIQSHIEVRALLSPHTEPNCELPGKSLNTSPNSGSSPLDL